MYGIFIIGDSMKILNNGIEQEIKLLTYFKLKNYANIESEYIIYTDVGNADNAIYLAGVFVEDTSIKLVKPVPESLEILKKIIQNLISNNPNSFIFSQNKYQYIELKSLETKIIEKIECQKIQLTSDQYNNLYNSKYLTYPYSNLTNAKKPEGFRGKYNAMADSISIAVSAVLLLIILGGLIAYQFDWGMLKAGVFDFDGMMQDLVSFDLYVHNYLVLRLAIISFFFALIAFNSEKTHPITVWFVLSVIFIATIIIWALAKKYISINDGFIEFLKAITVYSICASTIFTLVYSLCKEAISLITNKLSFCNFITFYLLFFLMFTFSVIGLGLFYNNYLLEHVQEFILEIIK